MKKKYTLFLSALVFSSIILASEDPDDETNTKTPNDASKIVPGSEKTEKHHPDKNGFNCRLGRKRRRQQFASEQRKMITQQKIVYMETKEK